MKIYDSVQKTKLEFVPIQKGRVKIYVCGPTVYNDAHLGHARSSVVFDLLRRVMISLGYEVEFVKNFTDIDDKIIDKMSNTGRSLEDITKQYTTSYIDEMRALNVIDPDIAPNATENIDFMKEFVQKLLDKGNAYTLDDGIYFDTTKDNKYLSVSHQVLDEDKVQNRAGAKESKRDFKDFALWKFSLVKPNYKASYGDGRPGWHIECSAMIDKHLAYKDEEYAIDIHGGGADLLFPHHENEAAQTRCATNTELAKYWMHNGFVNINGEKMSKSLGNSFFLKDALRVYSGEVLRFYLLSTHYRANLNFNEEDLLASKKRLDKIYRVKKRVVGVTKTQVDKEFEEGVLNALSDDLNISVTLAYLDEYISLVNETMDKNPKDKVIKQQFVSNLMFIDKVLGIGGSDPYEYFQFGISVDERDKIEELIAQRESAKKEKNYEKADTIRAELSAMSINIMDTPNGTVWEKN